MNESGGVFLLRKKKLPIYVNFFSIIYTHMLVIAIHLEKHGFNTGKNKMFVQNL